MSYPQLTPARPVPGAFINTPAISRFQPNSDDPVRRRLFGNDANNAGSGVGAAGPLGARPHQVSAPAPTTPGASRPLSVAPQAQQPPQDVPPVTKAAQAVNRFLQADQSFPELDSYARSGVSSDYDLINIDSAWAPFHKTHMYPIPNEVFNHYNAGQLQTLMGLFADINHAWVAIDNSLFLWDYTHPDPELIGFEDQPHTIHAVALVPPKPGIFVAEITHMLVVATASDIILLGLSAQTNAAGNKTVTLFQTKLNLSLRGTDVRHLAGSADGRIFFGGSTDTDINELYYQEEERWFSNRCGRINHTHPKWTSVVTLQPAFWSAKTPEHLIQIVVDDSRKLLYTLSSTSTIRTYHMENPNKLTKVIEKEKNHCLRDITHMINGSPLIHDKMHFVSISPISSNETPKLHLMALTNTGCRLFLSATNSASYMLGGASSLAPQSMMVQYIKFPPSDQLGHTVANSAGETVLNLSSRTLEQSRLGERFPPGYFLDFVVKENQPNSDLLFVSAPETGRIKATGPTSVLKYWEHGNWIDIGSRAEAVGLITKPFAAASQPLGFGNELAVQFDDPPSEFAVLTNTGVHVIRRRRLVDVFAAAIRSAVGDEGLEQETRKFIQLYGRVETISCALAVACGHGGDSRPGAPRAIDQLTEDRARTVFVDYGGQPTIAETDSTPLTTESVRLSSRHDALCVYLTRLIRTLWKSNVVATNGALVTSKIATTKLITVQEQLERLRRFLNTNRGFIQGLAGPVDLQRVASKQEEVALQAEHQALHAIQKLMEGISEGISFVLMLFDERVSDIYMRLEPATQQQLRELTFEKLFSQASGKDLAKVLVKSIVNRNIESGSNVETVADALRRRCGSFCSPDDVVIFKAQEQLKRASEQALNSNQSRSLLHESLRLFERVAGNLSFINLSSAVSQYVELKYYAGAIQLCLVVAKERDRGNSALSWVNEGKPANDPRANAFAERKRCYDLIHDALRHLDAAINQEPEEVDGRLTLLGTKRLEAYEVVNGSDDEVFHFDLYEWYIQQGWSDRLLSIDSPHVVTFLQRLAGTSLEHADLLCRFYTQRSRYFEAAEVQAELAMSDFAIGIKDRVTLLSRAKANAEVKTVGISQQQQRILIHSITEELDVANIQADLLDRLRADSRINDEKKAEIQQALDGRVRDLSELFNSYADKACYYDLCLLIYDAANYHNTATVKQTWSNLIEQTHEEATIRLQEAGEGVAVVAAQYESVSDKILTIAHRVHLDSAIFPIEFVLSELCRYSLDYRQDGEIGAQPTWPVSLFVRLKVPYQQIVRSLENVFDRQETGFTGNRRIRVIELIVFAAEAWQKETRRHGAVTNNGEITWNSVRDLLTRCEAALPSPGQPQANLNPGGADVADLRRELRTVRRDVEGLVERSQGSLRFL
ncbi:nucleoporin Nup157/170 [Sodiomyces alkalinus F11]|uniref:Nucleoporin Nup157/170 n=1 Tax=Sodiomyces alkalinus (strain CBS 110278 / VKM F-3762 / F11) TaxID=1314773 RepID=A0A3N2Q6I9_SODAK|nr:nucleoporin Nup157/170 [Sodiomyces alkalinus F11]ROT42235.1 nucleoporin Nup157/170 [Sodiomyces alkalinus F11]